MKARFHSFFHTKSGDSTNEMPQVNGNYMLAVVMMTATKTMFTEQSPQVNTQGSSWGQVLNNFHCTISEAATAYISQLIF